MSLRFLCSRSGGSSPRVRGTHECPGRARWRERFIPAGAGNARTLRRAIGLASVHPRGCGERPPKSAVAFAKCGSSPRVRGTLTNSVSHSALNRFIPAGAGNATNAPPAANDLTVHPRGCGERAGKTYKGKSRDGSSPRVRGTRRAWRRGRTKRRFIPAGAGNAPEPLPRRRIRAVHPRGCGERRIGEQPGRGVRGSSPRVRGTRRENVQGKIARRFIPAGAGNASNLSRPSRSSTVHPRGCGERGNPALGYHDSFGSSPRVRGTRWTGPCGGTDERFIPAGAGNAPGLSRAGKSRSVHPRGCGERTSVPEDDPLMAGSSPRVRGTLPRQPSSHRR